MKRAPAFRKVARILLVVFAIWVLGVAIWAAVRPDRKPEDVCGRWQSVLIKHPATGRDEVVIRHDGTYQRKFNSSGSWTRTTAWVDRDDPFFRGASAKMPSLIPRCYTQAEVIGNPEFQEQIRTGKLKLVTHAFLVENPSCVVVLSEDGSKLYSSEQEWWLRRRTWRDQFTDWVQGLWPKPRP